MSARQKVIHLRRTEPALNAKLALEEAKANLAAAKNKYEYSKKMHSKGYVTEQDVEAKASELERAKIRLELARTGLEAVAPSGDDDDEASGSDPSTLRLLQLDVEEAEASLKAAERNHARLQANHARGAVTQEALDEAADKVKHAKIQVERARVKLDARGKAQKADGDGADAPPAGDGAANDEAKRLLEIDAAEAAANFNAAERAYERVKRLYATRAVEQSLLDEQAHKYERAKTELERAQVKLRAVGTLPASDGGSTGESPSSGESPIDVSQIVWGPRDYEGPGEPIATLQLGHFVEPNRATYAPGDVVTARLFLKYTGKDELKFKAPRNELLEKHGLDLVLRDDDGDEIPWRWGPAHKGADDLTPSGDDWAILAPGAIYPFLPMKLVVGPVKMLGRANYEPTVFAYLDVKPGQTARLLFKLTRDPAGAGTLTLQCAPFEFRVEETKRR